VSASCWRASRLHRNCSAPRILALPQLPCLSAGASGSGQHPLAEQSHLSAVIALPLQECQFLYLACDLSVTVRLDESLLDGSSRAQSTIGDVHERWHLTREAVREPRVKRRSRPLTLNLAKALGQRGGCLKPLVVTSHLEELLVGWCSCIPWTSQQPDKLPGRR
jgi:hypothetical protein